VLVEGSTYNRYDLKRRLVAAGLLAPRCGLCGQGERWHGKRMSLVLDHINGISNDNRIENLRMVCASCAATLDTHCAARKVERPSYEQLMADVASMSFVAIGRKYGVSDNAIRKWTRWYEHERRHGGDEGRGDRRSA
jgi:hypothetical protein